MAQNAVERLEQPQVLSTEDALRAYRTGLRVRAAITQCLIEMRKGAVRFWIGGPGEEVHGAATALAIYRFEQELATDEAWTCALFPHYRSDTLITLLAELRGHDNFTRDYFRQALSRASDPMTAGRQMVMHVCDSARGIMPAQSPLGMNLSKAAGYARARQAQGRPGVAVAVCGDGTTSTSDFHETATAASVWRLPLLIVVTDNELAISVTPDEGRGIKDFERYAGAFGLGHFACDGHSLQDTAATTLDALRWIQREGRSAILHARVPRLRGHSSSDGAVFSYDARDPLLELGEWLVERGHITTEESFRRKAEVHGLDYFDDHELGSLMTAEITAMRSTLEQVRAEPTPRPGSEYDFALWPIPDVDEPETDGDTAVQINEALNLCLHRIFAEGPAVGWGQDVAREKGGVFKVTRGLSERFPGRLVNAPINEPLIMGTAVGAAHDPELRVLPEIQFGDYALNTLHWLVHAGNIYWGSNGEVALNITLRTPVDPVSGGALYHSMSIDGFFTPVPGWLVVCPSTAFDAYGLLRSAAEYRGPVLFLEPKCLYRRAVGPALPGEPNGGTCRGTRRQSGVGLLSHEDLECIEDYRVPFGKAVERRAGTDLTIVAYGNASLQALDAARALAADGIEAQVIDLRSLVPWDKDRVLDAVRQTGRLLIAHQDRTFAGFGREIQGTVHETLEGVATLVVGMRNVPAVGQAKELEEHTVLSPQRIEEAARDLLRRPLNGFAGNDQAWLQHAPTRRTI